MKKFLSLILAVLLVFSVMAPITAFAENGPYPFDPESENLNIKELSAITFMYLGEDENIDILDAIAILYPQIDGYTPPETYKGASYNLETNTLTLKNVKAKYAGLTLSAMGDDFKIKLIGYNELGCIMSSAQSRGGSITIIGDGELVLNRTRDFGGIVIDANETASTLNIESTVKFKAYASPEFEIPAIDIYSSACTDSAKLINLGGTVTGGKPVLQKYKGNVYEQSEAYDLEWNCYDWYEFGLTKDGVYYIADEQYDEETYDFTGKYIIHSVAYDEILDCYTLTEYANGKPTSLQGFTKLTENKPIYDEALGFYIGYTDNAEDGNNSYKRIFDPEEKEAFDLCVDKNGTKYGFYQYTYEENGVECTNTYIYKFIEHPVYGLIAIEDENRNSLDGLTTLKIGEKEFANSYINSDVAINNGGSVVEPATIKGIELKNTNQGVKISWKADSSAEKYRVYRKKSGDKTWKILYNATADETSYIDKTVKNGTKYLYTVRGYNYVGWGNYNSKGVEITHVGTPKATAKNTSNGIYLKWTKIAGAEKYSIYRQTDGSSKWTLIDTTQKTTFTDKTTKSGTKYYYRVRAVANGNMSGYEVVDTYYLSTPKPSSVKNASSGATVTWKKVTGAQGYKVYRKTGSGDWKLIATTTNNKKFSYTDKTAKSGKTYYYSVQAYSNKTTSTYDKTGLKLKYLAAPKAKTKVNVTSIKISWDKVSSAKEYAIYRKSSGESKWKKITTTTKLSYIDKNVKNNKTYSYRVKAINGKTISSYKTVKQLFLSIPKLSSVKNIDTGVKFTWKKVNGAEGYKIYRKTGSGDFKLIATTTNNKKFTYTDKTAKAGTAYTYTVKAYNGKTNSSYNKTGLKIRFVSTNALYSPDNAKNGVRLRWEPADKADKYYVYRKVDGESSYKQIAIVSANELKKDEYGVLVYVDKTAKNGKTYFYNLKASYKNTLSAYASTIGRPITYIEPVDVTSAKATSNGIKITWKKSAYATGYTILRKEAGVDENYRFYSSTNNGKTTTFVDNSVETGKTYTYAVQAIHDKNNGKGGWSAIGGSKSAKAK